jgi:hypothetical protein
MKILCPNRSADHRAPPFRKRYPFWVLSDPLGKAPLISMPDLREDVLFQYRDSLLSASASPGHLRGTQWRKGGLRYPAGFVRPERTWFNYRMLKSSLGLALMSQSTPIKEEARRLVDELPENATWSDFARLVIERQRVEEGITDLDAGVTWTSDEIRNKLGIPK